MKAEIRMVSLPEFCAIYPEFAAIAEAVSQSIADSCRGIRGSVTTFNERLLRTACHVSSVEEFGRRTGTLRNSSDPQSFEFLAAEFAKDAERRGQPLTVPDSPRYWTRKFNIIEQCHPSS